jgi:hypothetical protein
MGMRTFIKVKTTNKSVKGSFHARYLSEREQDLTREEPESRPLFTHEQDGVGFCAADHYLAGGERPQVLTNELQHLIIAFNEHDARELQKLEIAPGGAKAKPDQSARTADSRKVIDESAKIALSRTKVDDKSAKFPDSRTESESDEYAKIDVDDESAIFCRFTKT